MTRAQGRKKDRTETKNNKKQVQSVKESVRVLYSSQLLQFLWTLRHLERLLHLRLPNGHVASKWLKRSVWITFLSRCSFLSLVGAPLRAALWTQKRFFFFCAGKKEKRCVCNLQFFSWHFSVFNFSSINTRLPSDNLFIYIVFQNACPILFIVFAR